MPNLLTPSIKSNLTLATLIKIRICIITQFRNSHPLTKMYLHIILHLLMKCQLTIRIHPYMSIHSSSSPTWVDQTPNLIYPTQLVIQCNNSSNLEVSPQCGRCRKRGWSSRNSSSTGRNEIARPPTSGSNSFNLQKPSQE